MANLSYLIADHLLCFEGADLIDTIKKISGFEPFATNPEPDAEPQLTITSEGTNLMISPSFKEMLYTFISEDGEHIKSIFGTTETGYLFKMDPTESEGVTVWCDKGSSVFYIKGNIAPTPMSIRMIRFAVWIAFGIATAHLGTVAIHTSTITYKGRNVLFLGESGTGKSTHTRLWRENIEGATLLNDDSPIVRAIDGDIYVYGSPWSGKTPCYKNERYPLAGCVRLSQAPYNKIHRLSTLQAYASIHPSCPPDFAYDEYLYDGISETLDKFLTKVPFYHLECLPNAEAAHLSKDTIFG